MQGTTPAMFNHCVLIYDAMHEAATEQERDGFHVRIYEGFLTKLFEAERLATPYYTSVMAELQRMDCVRQLRRGGGSSKSEWLIVQRPTEQLWELKSSRPRRPKQNRRAEADDETSQRMKDMQKSIDFLYEYTGAPRPVS